MHRQLPVLFLSFMAVKKPSLLAGQMRRQLLLDNGTLLEDPRAPDEQDANSATSESDVTDQNAGSADSDAPAPEQAPGADS